MSTPTRLSVARCSAQAGYQEFRAVFDIRWWLTGWVLRLGFQVLFFGMVGRYVGGEPLVQYMLLGNVLAVIALEGTTIAQVASGDRDAGMLAPLVRSRGSHVVSVFCRGTMRIVLGVASSSIVFLTLVIAFRMPMPWPRALLVFPVLFVVSCSCYGYGCFVAALVYRFTLLERSATNIAYLTITVLAGVNVPVTFWPWPLRLVSKCLPVTHGLSAVRVLMGAPAPRSAAGEVATELVVGVIWFLLGCILLRRWIERDRSTGRLDRG